jgi:hypothetical protein
MIIASLGLYEFMHYQILGFMDEPVAPSPSDDLIRKEKRILSASGTSSVPEESLPKNIPVTASIKPSLNQQALNEVVSSSLLGKLIMIFLFREGKAVRNGWLAILLICGASVFVTYACTKNAMEGKLAEQKQKLDESNGELVDSKHDRDKYQELLAPFEARALSVYTNAPIDESLRLFFQNITNAISDIKPEQATFDMLINGMAITNVDTTPGALVQSHIIYVDSSKGLHVRARTTSKVTALRPAIDMMYSIGFTNISFGGRLGTRTKF